MNRLHRPESRQTGHLMPGSGVTGGRRLAALAIGLVLAVVSLPVAQAAAAPTGVSPHNDGYGFMWGSDSPGPGPTGTAPYRMPYVDPASPGSFGGYFGEIGTWSVWQGCGGRLFWNPSAFTAANVNRQQFHRGVGGSVYWIAAGPGLDPATPGRMPTYDEARAWGAAQAARTLQDITTGRLVIPSRMIVLDIEQPQVAPALDNGWNHIYPGRCGGTPLSKYPYVPTHIDRGVFDGYTAYIATHSSLRTIVYSAPGASAWDGIFGTGTDGQIPNTWEWTYESETRYYTTGPRGWCVGSTCASFFGGQSSANAHALMWQWSGGGGVYNGKGDFDQIDVARFPA
ncbi:MAG: hypothetical protein ACR2FF_10170 [Mycobacteriales bacterium]